MDKAFVYQISTPFTLQQAFDPGFRILDNTANERPDWREYWPIRRFLLNEALDEEAFYGFLSAKFKIKTNLSSAQVYDFIRGADSATDVILFSQSIHNAAFYLNTFEYGESEHPGLLQVARQFFDRIGRPTDFEELVTDSRSEVYSNYFVAKPRFWREWLEVNELLFSIAETQGDDLGAALRAKTMYRKAAGVEMKIFVMERVATWIIARGRRFTARVRDPFAAHSRTYKLPVSIVCDALKIAYNTQGRRQYRDVFFLVRGLQRLLNWQIRFGIAFRSRRVRPTTQILASYWDRPER